MREREFAGARRGVKEFEDAIRGCGLVPREVRLERNRVRWFLCSDPLDECRLWVFDGLGHSWLRDCFAWPLEVEDIAVEGRWGAGGELIGVEVDGAPAYREGWYDLFEDS